VWPEMGHQNPTARITSHTEAGPESVYDLLADLPSHLQWAGSGQSADFRLLALEAPVGPAVAGTIFTSTGTIPMSARRWSDRSTVTIADRPRTFEFTTDARAGEGRAMTARYSHRYEIAAEGSGSRVTYTLTQLAVTDPMLRMALPGIRWMTWRVAIPMFAGRGFRSLLALAERSVPSSTRAAGSPIPSQER
jgi:hypothetical protein